MDEADYTMGTDAEYTLYAIWSANENTLQFDANGGTGTMPPMLIDSDDTQALNSNLFISSITGYVFVGWATTAEGEVEYLNEADYTMGTATEYTLYAVWLQEFDYTQNSDSTY